MTDGKMVLGKQWMPSRIIIDEAVQNNTESIRILKRCKNIPAYTVRNVSKMTDFEIISTFLNEKNEDVLSNEARNTLYLTEGAEVDQQMAAGSTKERRCYNFLKILPYKGVCTSTCAYCWFKDRVLLPRINVRFFEYFSQRLKELREQMSDHMVFTFTHYKTDCMAIEHLTGFGERLVKIFEAEPGFYIQFLTKHNNIDFLLRHKPKRGTFVCFSLNAPRLAQIVEIGASTVLQRIEAARKLEEAGFPIFIRIDPMMPIGNWKADYEDLVHLIQSKLTPKHVTVGMPRFQDLEELKRVADRVKNGKARYIMVEQARNMGNHKPGCPQPTGKTHYFKNMPVSYPNEVRLEMYRHMILLLKEAFGSNLSIGLCEEPSEIWESCGLDWSGDKKRDCSCNFIPRNI